LARQADSAVGYRSEEPRASSSENLWYFLASGTSSASYPVRVERGKSSETGVGGKLTRAGTLARLVTLMDAAILIRDLEPFRQARPGDTRKRADVAEAPRQVLVALERENWWRANAATREPEL
jgi:hypothetical protein